MAFPVGLMPDTFEEFEGRAFNRDRDQERDRSFLAEVIANTDSPSRCAVCDKAIVSAVWLAETIAKHYGLSEYRKEILVSDLEDDAEFDFGNGTTCGAHSRSIRTG